MTRRIAPDRSIRIVTRPSTGKLYVWNNAWAAVPDRPHKLAPRRLCISER